MLRVAILVAALATFGLFAVGPASAAGGPMADAGLDQTVTVETTVHLDGTGSGHPDGTLSGYEWTIRTPDGREIEPNCPTCERTQFTPSTVGRYEVTLTVTGSDGARSTDTLYVYVEDAGPDVELSGDRTPDPDEPVTFTAAAESSDAELEEIAWAVEDEIVTLRSLDGTADESELTLTFTDAETYRVQVVVRDSNGRTAYDQLYVQPQSESVEPTSWSEVDPPDCSDSGYAARNSQECWDIEVTPSPSPDNEPNETPTIDPEEILYQTDGYQVDLNLGQGAMDSSYMNTRIDERGFDNGENAPWNSDGVLRPAVDEVNRFLFGQDRKTVSCEMTVGEISTDGCHQRVLELENQGETTNVYSPSEPGAYSEYGLSNAERVRGENPNSLKRGQDIEVTIVIQQEEDGLIDQTVEAIEPTAERVRDVAGSVVNNDGSESSSDNSADRSSSTTNSDNGVDLRGSVSSSRGGYLSSSSESTSSSSTSSEPTHADGNPTPGDSRPGMGLVA